MTSAEDAAVFVEKSFEFLKADFGFRERSRINRRDYIEYRYSSNTTGVVVAFELREFFIFVTLCRLVDDNYAKEIGEIRPDSRLNCFDLNDLVGLRAPDDVVTGYLPGQPQPLGGLAGIAGRQATNLRKHARDVLTGDFTAFPDLERIVKARAREAAIQEWGPQAKEFGWDLD
jgi:hypothetical protein